MNRREKSMTTQTINEAARSVPVKGEYDVIVAGGGLGGIAAAIAAARTGAKTLLIERNTFVGGVATAGMCCSIFNCYYTADHRLGPQGIPVEIADALADAMGYGKRWHKHKGHIIYDIERGKLVLQQMLEDAGVDLLLDTQIAGAVVDANTVKGVIVENKSGRDAWLARVVVDATGDADVAAAAGAPVVGTPEAGAPTSLCFRLGNVNADAFVGYFRQNPNEYPTYMDVDWDLDEALAQYDDCGTLLFPHGGGIQMRAFQDAKASGDLPASVGLHDTTDACQMHVMRQTGIAHVVTGFVRFDGLDMETITRSIADGRRMAFTVADVYCKYIPGFDQCYVAGTAANLGVRFSRRIEPDVMLTKEDYLAGRSYPDAIGRCVVYEHEKKHKGPGAWSSQVMSDRMHHVPLGCLLPQGMNGLIMGAGRSAGVDQYWILRVMVTTMAVGQGAGVAAALAASSGQSLRELDMTTVQGALKDLGQDLDL